MINLNGFENKSEIVLAVDNVKAGREISKTNEVKGYGIIQNAITRLMVRLNIEEAEAVEIVKFCIVNNYTDTEIRVGRKLTREY